MKLQGQGVAVTFDMGGDVLFIADSDFEAVLDSIYDEEGLYGAEIESAFDD